MKNVEVLTRPIHNINLYEIIMPDYDEIKEDLKEYIYNVKVENIPRVNQFSNGNLGGIGPHPQRHKNNLLESNPNLFDDTSNPALNKLIDFCYEMVSSVIREVNNNFVDMSNWVVGFQDSWFHITKDGGYHDYHAHHGSPWSGIFYVDIGDCDFESVNGVNRFYSPLHVPMLLGLNSLSVTNFDIEPENGKLVISPGFMPHSAVPYKGDKDRIIIAFNTKVVNNINGEYNEKI